MQVFLDRSDLRAWFAIIVNWGIVALAFTLVALWPNPLSILVSLMLLGGRQLGCGALMHECGHGSMFKSKALNRWVGDWLCAGPVMYRLDYYMNRHLEHHRRIGSTEDPDLPRYQHYPVSIASFKRKLVRDLTGRTTFNFLRITLAANGVMGVDDNGNQRFYFLRLVSRFHAAIISNLVLFLILLLSGVPELYLLWLAAFFSFYMVFTRIRNLAEHAVVPELFDDDPLNNTRTTIARWWERLTVAPNSVNYHLEHHLVPSVPKYRLAAFHQALKSKGLLQTADIAVGYGEVIRKLITNPEVKAAA